MKKYICVAVWIFTTTAALTIPITEFTSYDELTANSPEIIIARCASTVDFLSTTNKIAIIVDGVIKSDIEVVSVIKGTPNSGLAELGSEYWPYRGEYLLVFADYRKDEYNRGYTAIEEHRVIPLGHNFWTNQLAGKTVEEQVNLIFKMRLDNLKDELGRDTQEKQRIEAKLKLESTNNGVSSNAPPVVPQPVPFQGRKSSF
jgi:hypothetical protein